MKKFVPVITGIEFETSEPVITKVYIYKYSELKDFYSALIQSADAMAMNAKLEMCSEKVETRHEPTMKVTINLAMKRGHKTVEEIGGAESLLDYRMKMWEVA